MSRALALLLALTAPLLAEPVVTTLDNGLTVITEEMHYAPVVSSVVVYRVGSRNECEGITGMSHFCEHMMFKGTPEMPKGRFWQIVQRNGGFANAFTSEDITAYFLVFPSGRIGDALQIESDRMTSCLFDSCEVLSERSVVHEERRMAMVDSPSGAISEALIAEAFGVHPYGRPVIGFDEDILAYDSGSACCYYRTYYVPSNAVLAIVGDFETEELLESIERTFGAIPPGSPTDETGIPREPGQTEARRVEIEHPSNLARLSLAFHTPSGDARETVALDLISAWLSAGRSSRLEGSLVRSGLASSAWAYNDGGIDPGLFTIGLTLMPGVDPGLALDVLWMELDSLVANGIDEADLEDLKARTRAQQVFQEASPLGRAMDLAINQAMFGDWSRSARNREIVEEITPEEIRSVAERFFTREGSTLAILNPTGEAMGPGAAREREALPTDIESPSSVSFEGLEIPDEMLALPDVSVARGVRDVTLPDGVRLIVKSDETFPIVSMAFGVPLTIYRQPPELAGLASVCADAALYGTSELGYEQFHRRLERRGSYVRFSAGAEYASGSMTLLSQDLRLGLEVVADLLIRPAFRPDDLEHVLREHMAGLERRNESVFSVASDNLSRIMVASPEQAMVPDSASLSSIRPSDVEDLYRACCRPEGTVLVVVGDIDADSVVDMAGEMFRGWDPAARDLPEIMEPEYATGAGSLLVETMPGRLQAAVFIGTQAPGYSSPDYEAYSVMNRILGSGIGSRLGRYVRDEQGLAYVVGSNLYSLRDRGALVAYLSTRSDYAQRAVESVLETIGRITEETVDPLELRLVQSSMVGRHALSNMSYSGIAWTLLDEAMLGRPLEYDLGLLRTVLSLDTDDVLDVARDYLGRSGWFVSVAGGVDSDLTPVSP
ncbi:insulinase family protein [Candidatus Fermentibacterales bacterium]|nr:insulinase family protein [Candidatus Fermentibacterales bacterium]